MDRTELLSKIAPFPIIAGKLSADLLSGNYRSIFRGQGMEFDEVRRYEAEDDVRSIDWNVSARFGVPFVKLFREEREMTVCVILDMSASMHTPGSSPANGTSYTLYEQGLLAAALIAYSAEFSGQRFSAVFFDNQIRRIFPPRKGKPHIMAFITSALEIRPMEKGTGLGAALTGATRLLKHRSLVVIISDFFSLNWEQEMGEISRKHDVIAIRITGTLENEIPCKGFINFEDPETGSNFRAPVSAGFQSAWENWRSDRRHLWESIARRSGAAFFTLSTTDDAAASLAGFFRRTSDRRPR